MFPRPCCAVLHCCTAALQRCAVPCHAFLALQFGNVSCNSQPVAALARPSLLGNLLRETAQKGRAAGRTNQSPKSSRASGGRVPRLSSLSLSQSCLFVHLPVSPLLQSRYLGFGMVEPPPHRSVIKSKIVVIATGTDTRVVNVLPPQTGISPASSPTTPSYSYQLVRPSVSVIPAEERTMAAKRTQPSKKKKSGRSL
ncbi:hypothetical protein LZ31DRAFT_561220 [Colletotrichum somersetense]|nr:hypothetical protein LZ31DRAFT_561220 [Colletotrichum somersetense]